MSKPLIGLTPYHDTDKEDIFMRPTYLRAVAAAGGLPIVLPLENTTEDLQQLAQLCDGFLFTGGPDLHPFYFGEQTQAFCGNVSDARDKMELELLSLIMEMKKPILGICRGVQTLNIGLGGNIYQDIKSQFKEEFPIAHNQPFRFHIPSHTVEVAEHSLLSRITGKSTLQVNSMHHQAVKDLAPGLTACGLAPSRLIEAIEMPGYPFLLGVQWHPEHLWVKDESSSKLFSAFVDACR